MVREEYTKEDIKKLWKLAKSGKDIPYDSKNILN